MDWGLGIEMLYILLELRQSACFAGPLLKLLTFHRAYANTNHHKDAYSETEPVPEVHGLQNNAGGVPPTPNWAPHGAERDRRAGPAPVRCRRPAFLAGAPKVVTAGG